MALAPGWPGTAMPYSTSVPITRRTVMLTTHPLQVLPGVGHGVDGAARLRPLPGHQGTDVHDPFALLPRDPCPVVRVGGVGQVLVLPELVHARIEEVLHAQPLLPVVEEVFDRHLLAAV